MAELRSIPSPVAQQARLQALRTPQADLLESLMQGFQTGQGIQNLPEAIQQQSQNAILQQLERQLRLQTAQQRLQDLQNPNAALVRQVQEQLALKSIEPTSGIVAAPVGLGTEVIGTPGAITEEQQTALITGGVVPPPIAAGSLEPITVAGLPTGFAQDLSRATKARAAVQAGKIAEIEARAKAAGITGKTFVDDAGNVQFIPSRTALGETPTATPIKTATGENLRAPSKLSKDGLTASRISIISGKAGEAGFTQEDIDQKYSKEGVTDWNRVNLDANKKIQDEVKLAAKIKSAQLPASLREKASGFIAAHGDLGELTTILKEFKIQGKEPDAWQRAVGVALEQPPDGVFSALYQTVLGQGLTADSREINAFKARVRSAVTRANAGLSQTEREIANVSQYSPATNDTLEQTFQKVAGLESYLRNQVKAITVDPNEWLKSFDGEALPPASRPLPSATPIRETTTSTGLKIRRVSQ